MELIAGMEEALAPHGRTVLLLVVPDLEAESGHLPPLGRRTARSTPSWWSTCARRRAPGPARRDRPARGPGRPAPPGPAFAKVWTDDAGAMTAAINLSASATGSSAGSAAPPTWCTPPSARWRCARRGARHGIHGAVVEGDYGASPAYAASRSCWAADARRPPSSSTTTSWRWPPGRPRDERRRPRPGDPAGLRRLPAVRAGRTAAVGA